MTPNDIINHEMLINIITIILGLLSTYFGSKWIKTKNALYGTSLFTQKLAIALRTLSEAVEDDRITPEEEKKIIEEWREIIEEGKKLVTDIHL